MLINGAKHMIYYFAIIINHNFFSIDFKYNKLKRKKEKQNYILFKLKKRKILLINVILTVFLNFL